MSVRKQSARLNTVPDATRDALQVMLRGIDPYYSNLIERQGTLEVDRAVRAAKRSADPGVMMALAVSEAEQTVDMRRAMQPHDRPTSIPMICEIHQLIFTRMPEYERIVELPSGTRTRIVEPSVLHDEPVIWVGTRRSSGVRLGPHWRCSIKPTDRIRRS